MESIPQKLFQYCVSLVKSSIFISALILFLLFPTKKVSAERIPAPLAAAIERVEAGEANPTRISLLRRHANSDQAEARLASRVALARHERRADNPTAALAWVAEFADPLPENRAWPRVEAHLEVALARFDLGQTYEAVRLLNGARDHSTGVKGQAVLCSVLAVKCYKVRPDPSTLVQQLTMM